MVLQWIPKGIQNITSECGFDLGIRSRDPRLSPDKPCWLQVMTETRHSQ